LPLVASDCIDPCVRPVGQQGRLLSPAAYDMLMAQRRQYVGDGGPADQQQQHATYPNVREGGINMQPLPPSGYRGDFRGQQGLMPASSAPGDITHLDGHSGYTFASRLSARSFSPVGAAHYVQEEVKFTATGLPPHQLQSPFAGYTGAPDSPAEQHVSSNGISQHLSRSYCCCCIVAYVYCPSAGVRECNLHASGRILLLPTSPR